MGGCLIDETLVSDTNIFCFPYLRTLIWKKENANFEMNWSNSEILAASIREECLDTDIMLKALQYD